MAKDAKLKAIPPIPAIPNPLVIAEPFIAFATSAEDVVGIFDQEFNQVFKAARPLKARVVPELKKMSHPVESGQEITDFAITTPVRIELTLLVGPEEYQNIYNEITQYYKQKTLLNIQTRSDIYPNQMIVSPAHEETPEIFDTLVLELKLEQVQVATTITNAIAPINETNTDTVNRGNQQAAPATEPQTKKASLVLSGWRGLTG